MPIPKLNDDWEEREILRNFLRDLRSRFYSSQGGRRRFDFVLQRAEELIQFGKEPNSRILAELRRFLGTRPWTALLVPSGTRSDVDRLMCSKEFLKELIFIRPEDPGLVLQMEEPPDRIFSLT